MQTRTLKLPDSFINLLANLPENGKVLFQHKVFYSELLILEENENISAKHIHKIELESRK